MVLSAIIFVVSLVTFFWRIDSFPLRNWDEAWYGEIIRNMASGQYGFLVSFWNGQYYFDKPPLYFWLSSPIVKFFGVGEWQVRFVSALAASFSAVLIFLIAKKLLGDGWKDSRVGIFSSLIFLTLGQVRDRFSHGNLDGLLVFFILAGFYLYLVSLDKKGIAPLAGIVVGVGFLIKGSLLGVFGLFVCFVYSFFLDKRITKQFYVTAIYSLFVFSIWLLFGYRGFGIKFIDWFLFYSDAGNLRGGLRFSFDIFNYLIRDIGFWFVPILFSIPLLKKLPAQNRKILLSLSLPAFLFVIALGFLKERFDWYLLPAYPLFSIIFGYFLTRLYEVYGRNCFILVALILVLQTIHVAKIENIYPDRSWVGANLGKLAREIIPKDDTIILDDKDFTSFLFYSEHKRIYIFLEQGGKEREWWIIGYKDIPSFLSSNSKSWIITSDEKKLPIGISGIPEVVAEDFKFFRLYW